MAIKRFRIIIETDTDLTKSQFNEIINKAILTNTQIRNAIPGVICYLATEKVDDHTTLKRRYP